MIEAGGHASSAEGIFLDAAAPSLQPHSIRHRLAEVAGGGIDVALTTAASIEDCRTAAKVVSAWLELERARRYAFRIVRSMSDIVAAKATRELAVVLHFQGADPIEDQLDLLNLFHAGGMRVMQLTYNSRNRLGDGCFESTDAGLSKFGRKALARMEELGIVVDLAHAGVRTALEAAEAAHGPMIISHANARALCDTPRNVTDEVIRTVAAADGVIGLCAPPFFVTRDRPATLDMLIDHAAHIADLVGTRHLGLGFDFADEDEEDYVYYGYDERYIPKPPWIWPAGISGYADTRNVAPALRARGFEEQDIRGILGENFLRVFGHVWGG
jgi:membrane dipeptidase